MSPLPIPAAQVEAYRGLLRLAGRLVAREIDQPLYHQMITADRDVNPDHSQLVDQHLAQFNDDQALEELAVEFCRLFIGPQPACPPYASAQAGEAKLGGRAARAVGEFLDRHRLRAVLDDRDAVLDQDHLSVHLALLAHLYGLAAGTVDGDLGAADAWATAQELLHTHIWPWANDYLATLASTARHAPYTTVARLTRRILAEAATWPAEPPTPPSTKDVAMLTIYSTTWCSYCRRLKTQLTRDGITYAEIDIETDPDAASYVRAVNDGNQIVPTVLFADGTAMTNPSVAQVKHHLANAG